MSAPTPLKQTKVELEIPTTARVVSKFNTHKGTNHLQLVDYKCEINPIGHCVPEKQLCLPHPK
jgi:hypothetical protein